MITPEFGKEVLDKLSGLTEELIQQTVFAGWVTSIILCITLFLLFTLVRKSIKKGLAKYDENEGYMVEPHITAWTVFGILVICNLMLLSGSITQIVAPLYTLVA